jgi:hypothetical protein
MQEAALEIEKQQRKQDEQRASRAALPPSAIHGSMHSRGRVDGGSDLIKMEPAPASAGGGRK